jgi:hypothetical protein
MDQPAGNEPGQRERRRPDATVLTLIGSIIAASAIGIVLSVGQRHAPQAARLQPANVNTRAVTQDPGDGALFSVADDLATHDIVLFGGVDDYASTWLWNGVLWTQAHPASSPPGRFGASAAYDPETRTVLLFGGRNELRTPIHDTWAWNGTDWMDLDSGAGGPPPGDGSDMAWDTALQEMVLITGSGVLGEPGDTWVWAGTHWTRPVDGDLPAGAFYSPMWFDPDTNALLAVGCCEGPPPKTGAVNTTWRWNGAKWTLLATSAPAPIDASTMALDPTLRSLVLCPCGAAVPPKPGLLDWDGSGWASIATGAPPLVGGVEVTDLDRRQLLLLGAPISAPPKGAPPVQVWTLVGSGWKRIDSPSA